MVTFTFKRNFIAPFYGWRSIASRLEPLQGGSLLFTTKFPEIPGTDFIDLGRLKGWVDLGAIHWFWTFDPWIVNQAPLPVGHCTYSPYQKICHISNLPFISAMPTAIHILHSLSISLTFLISPTSLSILFIPNPIHIVVGRGGSGNFHWFGIISIPLKAFSQSWNPKITKFLTIEYLLCGFVKVIFSIVLTNPQFP